MINFLSPLHLLQKSSLSKISLGLLFSYFLSFSAASGQEDCRLKKENIKPLIERFNPYFSNHIYKSTTQTELAKMGKHRLLVVKQSGCKRHHINFNLLIEADAVIDDKEFWIAEAKALLHKVFYKGSDYARLGPKFDKLFEEKFKMYGMKRKFNFPIGTRNFICQVVNDPEKGGQIAIEMVSYIFRERVEVKRRRISLDKDDGWKAVDGN